MENSILNNAFWSDLLITILTIVGIILILFHSYEDYKFKSINALLTIITLILFFIVWYLDNISFYYVWIFTIIFLVINYFLSVFIKIFSGDIILLPTYIILFMILLNWVRPTNDINFIIILWLVSIIVIVPLITIIRFKRYQRSNNLTLKEIKLLSPDRFKEIQFNVGIPVLPIMTWLFIIIITLWLML